MTTLQDAVTVLKGIGRQKASELAKLGIQSIEDLLSYYPYRYEDRSQLKPVHLLEEGNIETVLGTIVQTQELYPRRGLKMLRVTVACETGNVLLIWFQQNHLKQKLLPGLNIIATGKIGKGTIKQLSVTDFELLEEGEQSSHFQRIIPVYRGSEKTNSKMIRKWVELALHNYSQQITEFLPEEHLEQYHLMDRKEAHSQIHFPHSWEQLNKARYRLVMEEFLVLILGLQLGQVLEQKAGIAHSREERLSHLYFQALPFSLTDAQKKVILEIKKDMEKLQAMQRLVQGDVGSGKTVIAVYTLLKAVSGGYQAALMAPTEILAEQHYLNLCGPLSGIGIEPLLLKSSMPKKEKDTVLSQLAEGSGQLVVGTHALIQKNVQFRNLGVVVIDEQHRFGVKQRLALENKGRQPDVLVMTATPIPRSLALTLYGDMDLSIIDKLPPGRQPVKTYCIGASKRQDLYGFLHKQIAQGYQAYIICPLVEDSEKMDLENATALAAHLAANVFPQYAVGLLHGKMSTQEKGAIMEQFRRGDVKILVSTTVIEVGVDVPNANVIVIENAERFGLAQLHQLRGRVGRGSSQAHCFLLAEMKTEESKRRMQVMVKSNDGFLIAEEDLRIRGTGEVLGTRQHGMPDLKIADLVQDIKILEKSKQLAAAIKEEGLDLPKYERLRIRIRQIYEKKVQLSHETDLQTNA